MLPNAEKMGSYLERENGILSRKRYTDDDANQNAKKLIKEKKKLQKTVYL
jgi:hypothetical protein